MSGAVSETIAGEGSLLLASVLFGAGLMMLYDMLRIFRHLLKHKTAFLAVEDVIYWLICAVGIFALLYEENGGLLRWFVIGGAAAWMLLENILLRPFIVRFFVWILKKWIKLIRKIVSVFTKPAKKVSLFFKKELKKIRKAFKIGISKQ